MDARTFLDNERRRFIKFMAIILLVSSLCVLLIIAVLLALSGNSVLVVFLVLVVCACMGYGATWALSARAPLWQAMVPICVVFLLAALGVGLLLPELRLISIAILVDLLLLCSLTNSRRLTLSIALACGLIGIAVAVLSLPAGLTFSLGDVQPAIIVLIIVSLIGSGTLVADRLIASQNAALALAQQRSAETEAAHAAAEAAQAEVARLQAAEQQRLIALVETLELPIISVGEQILVVPLVGDLDRRRIANIQQRLLGEVTSQRANIVVFDLTGISMVDTLVAQQLVQMAQAVQLLGARILLSGIHAELAHTMVALQIDLAGMQPVANLGAALRLNANAA